MSIGRKGYLGGTFNPIHYGHLRMAEEVREALKLEKVVFIPAPVPPLKDRDIAPPELRLQMVRLAVEGNPFFEVSDLEYQRTGKSYTVDTMRLLRQMEPEVEPVFILGLDAFLELPQWHRPEELISLCDFAVVRRAQAGKEALFDSPFLSSSEPIEVTRDYEVYPLHGERRLYWVNCRVLQISASDIRKRLREGRSIKYLLPESVESFIIRQEVYLNNERGGRS